MYLADVVFLHGNLRDRTFRILAARFLSNILITAKILIAKDTSAFVSDLKRQKTKIIPGDTDDHILLCFGR